MEPQFSPILTGSQTGIDGGFSNFDPPYSFVIQPMWLKFCVTLVTWYVLLL